MSSHVSRNVSDRLLEWKEKPHHKPLIVRGARQVGKTAAIKEFGTKHFQNSVTLNLELSSDRGLFTTVGNIPAQIAAIELAKSTRIQPGQTLLFLDEIQESEIAMAQLRYFYEEAPELHVIAAGSLLEATIATKHLPFPVGRVENCFVYPFNFDEFLSALQYLPSKTVIDQFTIKDEIPEVVHNVLLGQFREFIAIGGMPEVVVTYAAKRKLDQDIVSLMANLQLSFENDVSKYATQARGVYLRHVIEQAPNYAGSTISYDGFGGSSYRSREMSEAFSLLEQASLLYRVFPSSSVTPPIERKLRHRPKLLCLDTGMVCYTQRAWEPILRNLELGEIFQGRIAEQVVGQILRASSSLVPVELAFWNREKPGATAEVDFLWQTGSTLIPLEVKSGKGGKLRSLFQYVEESDVKIGVCINSYPPRVEHVKTPSGKDLTLVFLPFYLVHRIEELLARFMELHPELHSA